MSTVVGMYEAKTNFSKLVARAEAKDEIIVSRARRPVARLRAHGPARVERKPGRYEGQIVIPSDLDELPEGFAEAVGE